MEKLYLSYVEPSEAEGNGKTAVGEGKDFLYKRKVSLYRAENSLPAAAEYT